MSKQQLRDFKVALFGGRADRTPKEAAPAERSPATGQPAGSGRRGNGDLGSAVDGR